LALSAVGWSLVTEISDISLSDFATGALLGFAVLCAHARLPPAAIMVSNASVATMFPDAFVIVSPLILILHFGFRILIMPLLGA
jgi:hypothetical protein